MISLTSLWLPILLSALAVFIASSILHMLTPWHKGDFKKLPNEDRAREGLRALAIPPGDYMTPCPSSAEEMKSPEFAEKLKQGPRMIMTVMPAGPFSMGKNLLMWLIYCVVVSVFAACLAAEALTPGAPYMRVFKIVGATAFIGYSLALWQGTIWYQRSWITALKQTIDGLIYGLLTAGIFGWLWVR